MGLNFNHFIGVKPFARATHKHTLNSASISVMVLSDPCERSVSRCCGTFDLNRETERQTLTSTPQQAVQEHLLGPQRSTAGPRINILHPEKNRENCPHSVGKSHLSNCYSNKLTSVLITRFLKMCCTN